MAQVTSSTGKKLALIKLRLKYNEIKILSLRVKLGDLPHFNPGR
ncbi:hypothetical protein NITGR_160042 [Nitrospina gracilis 3/211]|uniref:Uncharacterized protein n=1 Tax=Nitrospina gracilis (strain 3/211) TaxID=1266370 RepID=M1YW86_NITG3|nr:hypothetical protein NITGR_160042 [Nitrospina gracilis 3/211]